MGQDRHPIRDQAEGSNEPVDSLQPGRTAMHSTMQDVDLLVSDLFLHGLRTHPESSVLHYQGGRVQRTSFREFGVTVTALAAGLRRLGVHTDDVVATLCWNSPAHLAAYFAVPGMGAVLHTLNLRLHDDQIVFIANHAADKVVLVDADLVPQLQRVIDRLPTIEHVIVAGEAAVDLTIPAGVQVHHFDDVLAPDTDFRWPTLNERSAAALCYTTGTTELRVRCCSADRRRQHLGSWRWRSRILGLWCSGHVRRLDISGCALRCAGEGIDGGWYAVAAARRRVGVVVGVASSARPVRRTAPVSCCAVPRSRISLFPPPTPIECSTSARSRQGPGSRARS